MLTQAQVPYNAHIIFGAKIVNRITLKHMGTDAKDCLLDWDADFAKMIFTLRADFLSPWLLLSFFWDLHHRDERFEKTKIIGAIAITSRFQTRLVLPSGTTFSVRAYQPFSMPEVRKEPIELEFFELPKES